jgi:hypothetical protein
MEVRDPYLGITPESAFELASAIRLPVDITLDHLHRRMSLVQQFDQARHALNRCAPGQSLDRYRQMALSLIGSERIRTALDLQREPLKLRETYAEGSAGRKRWFVDTDIVVSPGRHGLRHRRRPVSYLDGPGQSRLLPPAKPQGNRHLHTTGAEGLGPPVLVLGRVATDPATSWRTTRSS